MIEKLLLQRDNKIQQELILKLEKALEKADELIKMQRETIDNYKKLTR